MVRNFVLTGTFFDKSSEIFFCFSTRNRIDDINYTSHQGKRKVHKCTLRTRTARFGSRGVTIVKMRNSFLPLKSLRRVAKLNFAVLTLSFDNNWLSSASTRRNERYQVWASSSLKLISRYPFLFQSATFSFFTFCFSFSRAGLRKAILFVSLLLEAALPGAVLC